ncbi:hypothetical protein FQA39_LY17724 [Lamprigera yunnana]|nr:hypothetical protein FQA39_LY17724 [Lamprigera yunnana]
MSARIRQRELQPGSVRIEHKGFSFLITGRLMDHTMHSYVNELQKNNVKVLVGVCEPSFQIGSLDNEGIKIYNLAYSDGTPPPGPIVEEWFQVINKHFIEDPNCCVAVHCVSGLGRAPVMVAMSLIELGMKYEDAVELIRQKKRGAFNKKQLRFLEKYRPKSRLNITVENQSRCCCVQ